MIQHTLSATAADILVVDDTPANLHLLAGMLKERGHRVRPVTEGTLALQAARRRAPDLILLDINMPVMNGYEVCVELKADPLLRDIPVIFISASHEVLDKVKAFAIGGVDYVTKPFHLEEVEARVDAHLKIRRLRLEIGALNKSLQERVKAQVKEISDSQVATILALAKLSEDRDEDTGNHILRVQHYCRALAGRLATQGVFGSLIDEAFIDTLFHASALHDIGKVGIPDAILLKPARLTPEEVTIMKTHAALGAETLAAVTQSYPENAFVRMGVEVARSHHERWDGSGYPQGLKAEAIPLTARIVVIADQYDALRNKRPYKPAFDAARTYAILTEGDGRSSPDHLDPRVLAAFKDIAPEFEAIFEELREPPATPTRDPSDPARQATA
ncbi:MAG: response regulator [Myxococcaceae bacterium]